MCCHGVIGSCVGTVSLIVPCGNTQFTCTTQNLKKTATRDELAAVRKEATRVSKSVLAAKHGAAAAMERSNEALAQVQIS